MGRPLATTPGAPTERVAALRKAYDAMLKDPEFIADAAKLKLDIGSMTGEELAQLVRNLVGVTPDVAAAHQAGDPAEKPPTRAKSRSTNNREVRIHMKVAEAIVDACVAEGVRLAAGLAGTHIGHLLDAIARREEIALMYARQERVALDIADGFARACGTPASRVHGFRAGGREPDGRAREQLGRFHAGSVLRRPCRPRHAGEPRHQADSRSSIVFGPGQQMVGDDRRARDHVEELILRRAFMQLRSGPPGPGGARRPARCCGDGDDGPLSYKPVASQPRLRCGADPAGISQGRGVDRERGAALSLCRRRRAGLRGDQSELVALAELLDAALRHHAQRQERVPRGPSAIARHRRFHAVRATTRCRRLPIASERRRRSSPSAAASNTRPCCKRPDNGVKLIQVDIEPSEINRAQLADIALMGDARIALAQMAGVRADRPARGAAQA